MSIAPRKKGNSENEAETGREGEALALTPNWLQFASPKIMFFQILIGLRPP